jgi:hypothetical protein
VCSEEVLEDREIRNGRVQHLLKLVICKLGSDEISAPELVVAATVALVQLFLVYALVSACVKFRVAEGVPAPRGKR